MSSRKKTMYAFDHAIGLALNYGQVQALHKLLDLRVPIPEDVAGTDYEPSLSVRVRELLMQDCEWEGIPIELSLIRKVRTDRLPKGEL